MRFINEGFEFLDDATTGKVTAIKRVQEIPDDYLADLRHEREYNRTNRAKNYHRVASVPISVAHRWLREEGLDIFSMTTKEIITRLRRDEDGGGAFITSDKTGY